MRYPVVWVLGRLSEIHGSLVSPDAHALSKRLGAVADTVCAHDPRRRADAAEPPYTPSSGLADFVRCRDLTCRAPGCDRPAIDCDIDHTIPYSDGG